LSPGAKRHRRFSRPGSDRAIVGGSARAPIPWDRIVLWILAAGAGARLCWMLAAFGTSALPHRSTPLHPVPGSLEAAAPLPDGRRHLPLARFIGPSHSASFVRHLLPNLSRPG